MVRFALSLVPADAGVLAAGPMQALAQGPMQAQVLPGGKRG
jgi:hypothetical protein